MTETELRAEVPPASIDESGESPGKASTLPDDA